MKTVPLRLILFKKGYKSPEQVLNPKTRQQWREFSQKPHPEDRVFVHVPNEKPPTSLQEFEAQVGETELGVLSQNFSYGVFFKVRGRLMFYSGGRAGGHMIDKSCIEKAFPIDVALKLMADCDLREVGFAGALRRRVKVLMQANDGHQQLALSVDPLTDRVMRAVGRTEVLGENRMIAANQHVFTTRISSAERIRVAEFLLDVFCDASRKKAIETAFRPFEGNLTRFEEFIAQKIRIGIADIGLTLPDFFETKYEVSYQFEVGDRVHDARDLDIEHYLEIRDRSEIGPDTLKADKVHVLVDGQAKEEHSVWSCLQFAGFFDKQFCFLAGGVIETCPDNYVEYMKKFVDSIPRVDGMLPDAKSSDDEGTYAKNVVAHLGGVKLLDRQNIPFGGKSSRIEIADLAGQNRLFFLKPLTTRKGKTKSSNVSYLLWQIEVALSVIMKSADFRATAAAHKGVAAAGVTVDDTFFENKRVVLGLITHKSGSLSSILPFSAVIGLCEFYRRMRGFNVAVEVCIIKRAHVEAVKSVSFAKEA